GVLRYRADGISVPSPGPSFGVFPTYNNNHENGLGSPSDGNIKLSLGYNWHVGIPQLVDMGGGELRLVGSGSSSVKFQGGSGSSTYNGRLGIDAKGVHDSMSTPMPWRSRCPSMTLLGRSSCSTISAHRPVISSAP